MIGRMVNNHNIYKDLSHFGHKFPLVSVVGNDPRDERGK